MLYLIAILLPPLAVLAAGKPFQAIINIPLTLAFWIPGMAHALLVVHNYYADQRTERLIKAMRRQDDSADVLGLEPDPPTITGKLGEGLIPQLMRKWRNHKRLRAAGR